MMDQLSLVVFTVLGQAAAGIAVVQYLSLFLDSRNSQESTTRIYLMMLVILGIAGVASLIHLGQPLRAINVLDGLAHGSPLSWEIITVALFGAGGFLVSALHFFRHPKAGNSFLALITALSGQLMVYAMSRVYNLHTVDVWFSIWTPVQFFVTSLLLGLVLTIALKTLSGSVPQWLKLSVFFALVITFMTTSLITQFLGSLPGMTNALADNALMLVRVGLLMLGSLLLVTPMIRNIPISNGIIAVGMACLVISELTGRTIFYDLLNVRLL